MLTTIHRLQLATRIHIALLCRRGEGVDVPRMLRQRDYADEALELCRDIDDSGALSELADDFDDVNAAADAKAHLAVAAQLTRTALAQIPLCGSPAHAGTAGSLWAGLKPGHAAFYKDLGQSAR